MKLLRLILVITSLAIGSGEGGDLSEEAFFASVAGDWSGIGELENNDGEIIPITESWTAASESPEIFSFSGSREWGEEQQTFRWEFRFNAATGLYECEYEHSGMDTPLLFEVSLCADQVLLRSPFGGSGGELVIENTLKGEAIEGDVRFTNKEGMELLGGKVIHTKR